MDPNKAEEIAKGIALCIENAEGLLKDAKLLFKNDRFPRAFSLAILALEEIGKVEVIATTLVNPNVPEEKRMERFKNDFTSHTKKQIPAILVRLLKVAKWEGINALREKLSSKKSYTLDKAKQFGFYVDFSEQFVAPANMIPRNLAKDAIAGAEEIIKEYQPLKQEGDLPSLLITFEKHYNEVLKPIDKDEELSIINRVIK